MKIVGFAGWSGSGKTTLIEQLIALMAADGLRVATIKHTHHDFDLDQEGKDSWRHRAAGASEVLLASDKRWALLHELRDAPVPDLNELLAKLSPCDVVIIEGCKFANVPKLEIYREALGKPGLYPNDDAIMAVVTDSVVSTDLPQLDLNQPALVYAYLKANVL
ncbi:molybdopterin-guanine dinucleotide biosynthesis protein B [Sulfuriferula nivalis]|uniref:Molybdopterin-guanine dinucleotide biosynthesis protein MobB n=1 Tax=Sulfuriferula nivalis TaxID=2675298 RepID=A0A809RHW2_9PROT|nr:molybdopterin-guanine dinucleotide biosynthesis protein B [Sulfuriferula nivalis]BBP01196.1 molybdopterin-guanine dinucleotide biosynthesis protein MobB [Sulfuriferula nivalis]